MEAVQVVCPSGLFPLPVFYEKTSESFGLGTDDGKQTQQQHQELMEQLQMYRNRASRLLTLLSVQREQGVKIWEQDVYALYEDAFACIQQSLQQAAAAKQPLLLTSTQHTSCFCQLLEILHLLDIFVKASLGHVQSRAASGVLAGEVQQEGEENDSEQVQLVQQVDALLGRSTSFISHLEQRLHTVPGIDGVLAALIQFCQQNMASGSKLSSELNNMMTNAKGKAEVIDVACLSSIQEQHSAARALPLLLKLYFTNCSRMETIAAGKPEALTNKMLDKCLLQLANKPVVPGYADMPLCLLNGLEACTALADAAASRKLKLPAGLPTDAKSLAKLEQSYSLQQKVIPLLQHHDMLCDLLSRIALEVRQAVAVDRDIDSEAFLNAEQLVIGTINIVSAANNALMELDAWRCVQQQQQRGSIERVESSDSDVVPFMDVAGAVKGLTGLMIDSQSWLQQLLSLHTVQQLHEFAASTLPALSKMYPRNERIQQLLRSASASMQGQQVDLRDDTPLEDALSGVSSMPVTPSAEVMQGLDHPFHSAPGPVAEGTTVEPMVDRTEHVLFSEVVAPKPVAEGLEAFRSSWRRRGIPQQRTADEEQQSSELQEEEEEGLHQMMAQAAVAAAEISAEAQRMSAAGAEEPLQQQQQGQQQGSEELAIAPAVDIQAAVGQTAAAATAAGEPYTFTAEEASAMPQLHHERHKHKRWGKGLIKSMRKGRHRPQPSPDPELCAAPAALAALEEILSGAEAEYYESEAAAAADEVAPAALNSSSNVQTGSNMGRKLRLNLSMLPDEGSPGLASAAQSNFSSMTSLTAAFEQPPDLPWEKGPSASGQEDSSGGVAAAAAAFERLAAGRRSTSRLAVNRGTCQANAGSTPGIHSSSTAASEALGATDVPTTDSFVLLLPPCDLDPEEAAAAAALELGLRVDAGPDSTPAHLMEACSSPRTAKKFHLWKFRSILQHHEKLSTTGASDLLPQTGANGTKAPDDAAVAAAQSGAVSRMRAALSMGRRRQAADVASAASAVLRQAADAAAAAEAEDGPANSSSLAAASDGAAAGVGGATPRVSQSDVPGSTQDVVNADQPAKQGRMASIISRVVSFRPQGHEQQPQSADGAGAAKGFKALMFPAKLKKAVADRRQAGLGDAEHAALQLEAPPPLACLMQLRVVLEQLMHEIKTETKRHLMMQLQMAAAAAAGSAGAKPDASIARPLKQVKAMIKAVHRMQLMQDYVRQLGTAADLSNLWFGRAHSSHGWDEQKQERVPAAAAAVTPAAGDADAPAGSGKVLYNLLFEDTPPESAHSSQAGSPTVSPWEQQQQPMDQLISSSSAGQLGSSSKLPLRSFPAALVAGCMGKLDHMPADLPLLALHIFWDARYMLQRVGLLEDYLDTLKQQEEACMRGYITSLVPQAYDHFKKLAAHQTVTQEVLSSCGATPLQPVLPIYLDALLREPCTVMLQGNYATVAQAAEVELSQPGAVLLRSTTTAVDATEWLNIAHEQQEQQQVFKGMEQALQHLLQQEHEAGQQQEALDGDHTSYMVDQQQQQQQQKGMSTTSVIESSKPTLGVSPKSQSPSYVPKQKKRSRKHTAAADEDAAASAAAQPAGQTPLMQKLEQLKVLKQSRAAQQQQQAQELARIKGASLIDVRQWLMAGLVSLLSKDAAELVERCRTGDATIVVEAQLQNSVLQRTHQLLSQYAPLPSSWQQMWHEANSLKRNTSELNGCQNVTALAIAASTLQMLDTAAYDSEARVFIPAGVADSAAGCRVGDVLGEVSAAVKPVRSFFGRQHLQSLQLLAGPAGQQDLLQGLMNKMDQEQVTLLEQLQQLQQQLPPAFLQLPPAEHCHDAGSVLQFYQGHLASATSDTAGCRAALGSLQRIGNCLALLHLMALQQSVQATPVFMQAAPFLGIVGRPLTDAAAAAECFEYEGLSPPPGCSDTGGLRYTRSCEPGLLMPEIEQLEPTEAARQAHNMQVHKELLQEDAWRIEAEALGVPFDASVLKPGGDLARHRVWQNSYFQKVILGPDADKVRGPALLLTQSTEHRVWQATFAADCMGPCLEHVQRWAVRLQQKLQGMTETELEDAATAAPGSSALLPLGASDDALRRSNGAPAEGTAAALGQHDELQQHRQQQSGELDVVALATMRLSQQGEVTSVSEDVSGIGVHDNSLFQQQSPGKEQRGSIHELSADADSAPPQQQQQQDGLDMAAAGAPASSTVASICKASLSKAQSTLHEHDFLSYNDDRHEVVLATPTCLKLESAAASPAPEIVLAAAGASNSAASAGSAGSAGSSSSNTGQASKGVRLMSPQDLESAAAAAAVAASQQNSPESGNLSNPWEAAGAAAAMLPAGSVAPAHAKLAYRALFDSNSSQQQSSTQRAARDTHSAERQLSTGSMSGRIGLAGLVGDASDAIDSSRSDTDHGASSSRLLSSGQVQLEPSAGTDDASASAAEGAEGSSPRRRRPRSRVGARERRASAEMVTQSSPNKPSTGGLDSEPEDTSDAASDSDHDVPDKLTTWGNSPHSVHQHRSRLGQRSSNGGAAGEGVTAEVAASTVSDSSTAHTSPGTSRMSVPKLDLESISPGTSEVTQPLTNISPAQQNATKLAESIEQSSPNPAPHTSVQQVSRPVRTADGGAGDLAIPQFDGSSRSLFSEPGGAEVAAEGSPVGSYPEDELLDGTCAELMRVKMERDSYRSEIEVLKNQLINQDQTIALLSGNFYTPRPTDCGSQSGRQELTSGIAAHHSYPILGDASHVSEGGHMQLESSGSGKSLPDLVRPTRLGSIVSQLQGIPEVSSEPLSPEQSDLKPEASKLSIRVQQPSPAEADSILDDSGEDDGSSSTSSKDSGDLDRDDSGVGSSSRSCKLLLPAAVKPLASEHSCSRGPANTAQLAVALSALKFALLLEAAKVPASGASSAAAASGAAEAGAVARTLSVSPSTSPLRRLKKASLAKASARAALGDPAGAALTATEQPIKPGDISTAAAAARPADNDNNTAALAPAAEPASVQHCGGSGHIAGGQYGDGPLLASAVLLQLAGQSRKHALLDATSRIVHWFEYEAVQASGGTDSISTAVAGSGTAAGGVGTGAANGIEAPKPSSRKRQEEAAEAEAMLRQQKADQQQLLQRLAAAARQADRVATDGSSIAARFAPPVPAHTKNVQIRVFRADTDQEAFADSAADVIVKGQDNTAADDSTAATAPPAQSSGKWVPFSSAGGARGRHSTASGAGTTPKHGAVKAVPVKSEVLDFAPAIKPWADLVPCNKPIQCHKQLPMPRPRPLLLPDHSAAAAAFNSTPAAAGGAAADPTGRLIPAVPGVTPGAGLVAAARAVHARDALLASMPRGAVYSFSVASEHNRSGKPDDGYSKAPSTLDLDSLEDNSPRKLRVAHQGLVAAAAAVSAGASRLGGRKAGAVADLPSGPDAAQAAGEQWGPGGYSGSEASSPSRSPARSPTKRLVASHLQP